MISTLEKEITFRFLKARKKDGFLNVISIFSFIGISLGVAVLIIVMSVMNGFRTELINKIVGFNAHITVKSYDKSEKYDSLKNKDLEQNLKEHFAKWAPYLKKYGLLIVELHTIDPLVSAKNIGKTAITAYDATHGFSDQYIIEYELFLKIALETGLKPDPQHEYTFPTRDIPIVSINRLL